MPAVFWQIMKNVSCSAATGVPPRARLPPGAPDGGRHRAGHGGPHHGHRPAAPGESLLDVVAGHARGQLAAARRARAPLAAAETATPRPASSTAATPAAMHSRTRRRATRRRTAAAVTWRGRVTDGRPQQLTQPAHLVTHLASRSISSATRESSRNLASARAIVLLTVPVAQFSTWATCASGRSS